MGIPLLDRWKGCGYYGIESHLLHRLSLERTQPQRDIMSEVAVLRRFHEKA
jgi:hypothetical protein